MSAAAEHSVKVDSITVNGSPAPANLTANGTLNNGDLSVQLQNKDGSYDLSSLVINPGDDVTVKVEAPGDFTPITETASGSFPENGRITPPSQSGGTEVITLEGSPVATSWTQTPPPANINDGTWPPLFTRKRT
ncbi:hypothetical protein [Alicyclobacillus mengziensis]|uniref:Uncharacterized protein n=1 Tax=Alicyclobacillus mengziensis TaxID=2931921 RepID=A0A9X7VYS4_9BACL|nr:hypothetical protein [Alicyclobacillus mengziensis]QSO47511.1 hypothetical protein JZ786_00090 [Alicyclobacillus mengziensis]